MAKKKELYNPSTTSPKSSRKACLCENNTYSTKCCKGNLKNQGIGNTNS